MRNLDQRYQDKLDQLEKEQDAKLQAALKQAEQKANGSINEEVVIKGLKKYGIKGRFHGVPYYGMT